MPKRKIENGDYKRRKSSHFSAVDHVKPPSPELMEIIQESVLKGNWKGRSHPKAKIDYVTGNEYQFSKQGKFKQLCGHRGIGLLALSNIEKGEVAYVAEFPGIAMPKSMRRQYKQQNKSHFLNRRWNSNSCHIMKANIISMKNETEVEKANGKLEKWSKDKLEHEGYVVKYEGVYSVIVATDKISANTFVNLSDYDNAKDYCYGRPEYLQMEKAVIQIYNEQCELRKKAGPRCTVCRMCCVLYPNTKKGFKNPHLKECKGSLLQEMWDNREL